MFKMCHRKSFAAICFCFLTLVVVVGSQEPLKAQVLLNFNHPESGKKIPVRSGTTLSIAYRGYLGQTEYFKSTLSVAGDSTLILGNPLIQERYLGDSKLKQALTSKEVRYSDLIAFRRISLGRMILKSTLSVGALVGSFVLLGDLYRNSDYTDLQKFGISIGSGLGVNVLIQLLLPENPKYKMEDGWEISIVKLTFIP